MVRSKKLTVVPGTTVKPVPVLPRPPTPKVPKSPSEIPPGVSAEAMSWNEVL